MSTNQTIDGVPREMLQRFAKYLDDGLHLSREEREILDELRALLDAARCDSCEDSGDLIDLTGEWRGYCVCPIGVALKNKPPPARPVAVVKICCGSCPGGCVIQAATK